MTLKLRKWDSVEYLKTEEDMSLYIEACSPNPALNALRFAQCALRLYRSLFRAYSDT
jgi:hypothetical protein